MIWQNLMIILFFRRSTSNRLLHSTTATNYHWEVIIFSNAEKKRTRGEWGGSKNFNCRAKKSSTIKEKIVKKMRRIYDLKKRTF